MNKEVADASCDFLFHHDNEAFQHLCFEVHYTAHAENLGTEAYRLKPVWAKLEELSAAFPEALAREEKLEHSKARLYSTLLASGG